MTDLIDKLQDLNKVDPLFNYSIQILSSGRFVLHGKSDFGTKKIDCCDCQCLREKMYRIVLNNNKR